MFEILFDPDITTVLEASEAYTNHPDLSREELFWKIAFLELNFSHIGKLRVFVWILLHLSGSLHKEN